MSIYRCDECELGFAYPIPPTELLNKYYKDIYRKNDRAHYTKKPADIKFTHWSNAQYAYISQFFNFDEAETVIDIGPGYGFLLREIAKNHPHLRLIAVDPDINSIEYLRNYSIEIEDLCYEIEGEKRFKGNRVDLIISSHSLEHMTSLDGFFKVSRGILKKSGSVFIEVPNCELTSHGYLPRTYDSPHLLFFTAKSFKKIADKYGFNYTNISTAGMSMKEEISLMKKLSNDTNNFPENIKYAAVQALKNILPVRVKNSIKSMIMDDSLPLELSHYQYGGDRWTIRALLHI